MATATIIQCSGVIPFTPSGAQVKGDIIVTVSRVGVCLRDIAANIAGELCVEGVASFPKTTGAIADGTRVFWNNSGPYISVTATDGLFLGTTVGASLSADATQQVCLGRPSEASIAQAAVVAALTDSSGGATADGTIGAVTATAALTDSTGGSATTTLAAITAGGSYAQADLTAIKNALASLAARNAETRTAVIALTDAVKEITTTIASILTSLKNAGTMASS